VSDHELHKQVNRGVMWSGASQAVIAVGDLLSQALVLALWVPSEDYGTALAAMAFYPALDTAADLGVASALIQRDDHSPEKISTVFWFNVLISLGLFGLLLALGPVVGRIDHNKTVGYMLSIYGLKLLFQNSYAIPFALLRKRLAFAEIAKLRTAAHLSESVGRILYAGVFGWTVWAFPLSALTRVAVFGVLMQALHPYRPRWVFRPREVGEFIRFGVRSSASQILYQLYTNADYMVVSASFGERALGIYGLAYQVVLEPVKMITNVVSDVAFPTFAKLRATPDGVVDQFIKFTRLNLLAVLPFVLVIAIAATDVMFTFFGGGKWKPEELELAARAAQILCAVGLLRALGFLGPPLLDGLGHPGLTLRYMIVAATAVPVGFVVFAWQLGPREGFMSVAIAWACCYPVAFAWLSYLVIERIRLPLGRFVRETWGIVASVAIAGAAGTGAGRLADGLGHGAHLAITGGTALAILGALLWFWQGVTISGITSSVKKT
jgi:O-antigen/teichoic acid export membrane protein